MTKTILTLILLVPFLGNAQFDYNYGWPSDPKQDVSLHHQVALTTTLLGIVPLAAGIHNDDETLKTIGGICIGFGGVIEIEALYRRSRYIKTETWKYNDDWLTPRGQAKRNNLITTSLITSIGGFIISNIGRNSNEENVEYFGYGVSSVSIPLLILSMNK